MQPAISVEQRSVSFFRHRDAQPTLLRSGVARRVGVVRFALRFAHRVHVVEQPGAWTVLRSTLPASCLPALVYCWELCFEQLKKNTIHADIARGNYRRVRSTRFLDFLFFSEVI